MFNDFPDKIRSIQGIPLNQEKLKTVTINRRIKFLDSLAFRGSSLASLADELKLDKCEFPILREVMRDVLKTRKDVDLLTRKGVYPYEFATSIEKLYNTKTLPPIEAFHSRLTGENCSEEDYNFAQEVWKKFSCQSMVDFTVLYMTVDTCLLAEAMLAFRRTVFQKFQLDMASYLSLPHLALDAMLLQTGAEVELMTDQEMVDLVKKGIRGVTHSLTSVTPSTSRRTRRERTDRTCCTVT